METMQNILTRRSVRKFADKPIEPDKLHTILEAAMSGPCAVKRPRMGVHCRNRPGKARADGGSERARRADAESGSGGDSCLRRPRPRFSARAGFLGD